MLAMKLIHDADLDTLEGALSHVCPMLLVQRVAAD